MVAAGVAVAGSLPASAQQGPGGPGPGAPGGPQGGPPPGPAPRGDGGGSVLPGLRLTPQDAPAASDRIVITPPPANPQLPAINVPGLSNYAPPRSSAPLAGGPGELRLSAFLTEGGAEITRGLVWRVFRPDAEADGRLPLVASAQGGSAVFSLQPGSYLVHASFGRAGATKRISVGTDAASQSVVLEAGGLKLDAVLSGGMRIPPSKLRFSIYEEHADANGERPLIVPNVRPNIVMRLNSGTYHVVSTYGSVNAVIRSDIHVEAGKLTEATVEHKAAEVTMKLVREAGGEAIADTSWSVLTDSGDIIRETVGAFASMVLAEGEYAVVAKNRERIYQREFTVVPGRNQEVEVVVTENEVSDAAD